MGRIHSVVEGVTAMQRFFSFLAGVFSGLIVGAVVALLLAPMSGDDLRKQMQERSDELVSDVKSAIEEERKKLQDELESLKRGEIPVT
jgi:gas vesicle protein